jgi:hypothetical protein
MLVTTPVKYWEKREMGCYLEEFLFGAVLGSERCSAEGFQLICSFLYVSNIEVNMDRWPSAL